MIFLSLVLVIVAAVTLVLGVFQDGLVLIYVSIATCVAAMAVLGVGVLLRRRQVAAAGPASYGDGARGASALARTPVAAGRVGDRTTDADDAVTPGDTAVIPADTADEDADAAFRRPADTDEGEVRPVAERAVAKRAVAKRAVATRAERATAAVVGGTAVAQAPVLDGPAAADAAPADRTPAPTAKKATAKKATARKATAKEATAKRATTKTSTVEDAAAQDATVREPAGATAEDAVTSARSISDLSGVRGLGPAKRAKLMERFGSVEALADATVQEISGVPGIGVGTAQAIKDALN